MGQPHTITVEVNGVPHERTVEPRLLLSDYLRHEIGLTGTHVGCEHGVCGACTVLLDDEPVRSCLMLAVQAVGHRITTVEALAPDEDSLSPLQAAFRDAHALQCGFCTPGLLMTLVAFLRDRESPTTVAEQPLDMESGEADALEIREALAGHLCRCTGYQNIVEAVELVIARSQPGPP